jgi:transposase
MLSLLNFKQNTDINHTATVVIIASPLVDYCGIMRNEQGQEVVAVRQQESMPILQRMKQWMEQEYAALQVKKSAIAQAMIYFLSRWEKWCVYTRDGRLNIDNNPIENAIRPVALGRKNYLFSGSHEASERAAMIYSLLATCKLYDINPYHWLQNVLETLHQFKANDIESLLPQNWKKIHQP